MSNFNVTDSDKYATFDCGLTTSDITIDFPTISDYDNIKDGVTLKIDSSDVTLYFNNPHVTSGFVNFLVSCCLSICTLKGATKALTDLGNKAAKKANEKIKTELDGRNLTDGISVTSKLTYDLGSVKGIPVSLKAKNVTFGGLGDDMLITADLDLI
jgi:hypothetical protein